VLGVPDDGVGVEIRGGVELELELLHAVVDAVDEDVGVKCEGLAGDVAEELHVDLVTVLPRHVVRYELHFVHRPRGLVVESKLAGMYTQA
jgi:hypothetical protein